MRHAFTILYSRIVIETLIIVGVLGLIVGRMRRRLRVSPRQRTRAPMLWLVNFTADARLHRRLRNLAAAARQAAAGGDRHRRRLGDTTAQRLAIDLEAQIIVLDERLVESRGLDFDPQRDVVRQIRADADRIEGLIERVVLLIEAEAATPDMDVTGDPIGAIADRVAQLERVVRSTSATVVDTATASPRDDPGPALDSPR